MSAIDHWDVIRYLLGVALVACNIGVWRGVSLEYSDAPWTKETGKRLLVRSLALEAFFAATLFVVDTAASIQQKSEIAQLELLTAGRQLTPILSASIIAELKPFSGQKLFISSYTGDAEAARLGMQLIAVFGKAGIKVFNHLGRTIAGAGGVEFGMQINAQPSDTVFAKALIGAIGRGGTIVISDKVFPASIRMEENSTTGIMVALRPL
jgi:hypothetical protein